MISLAEAWGEIEESTSAMKASIPAKKEAREIPSEVEVVREPTREPTQPQIHCQTVDIAAIVTELQILRKEENSRSTIYIILICILFSLLFIYIDRLNNQIREYGRLTMMYWRQNIKNNAPL